MPALVGVVVVVLAAIVAWVLSGQIGSDQVAVGPGTTAATTVPGATTVPTTAPPSTVPDPTTIAPAAGSPTSVVTDATTPVPLPTNVANQGGTAVKGSTTTTTVAETTDGGSGGGSSGGEGDLGIKGHPIQAPTCDGAFVTVVASAVGKDVAAGSILQLLNTFESSNYLRTDKSCASFAQSQDGQPIYVVYLGPFAQPAEACAARSQRPGGAYVKRLTDDPKAGGVKC